MILLLPRPSCCCSPIRIMPRRKWKGWSEHSFGNVNTCDDFRYLLSHSCVLCLFKYLVKIKQCKGGTRVRGRGTISFMDWSPSISPLLMIAYQLVYSLLIILLYELSGPDDCLKLTWSLLGVSQYAVILPCTVSDLDPVERERAGESSPPRCWS